MSSLAQIIELAKAYVAIGPQGIQLSTQWLDWNARVLGAVFERPILRAVFLDERKLAELWSSVTSADDEDAIFRRAVLSKVIIDRTLDEFRNIGATFDLNDEDSTDVMVKSHEWAGLLHANKAYLILAIAKAMVGYRDQSTRIVSDVQEIEISGKTLRRDLSFMTFTYQRRTYKINSTEAEIVKRLWQANGTRWVSKADLLKPPVPSSYQKISKAFGSEDGERFYNDLVVNDRRGRYALKH